MSDKCSMEPQANTTSDFTSDRRGQKTNRMQMWFFFSPPDLHPWSDIKQTCWNVNGTWRSVHRAGRASTLGDCAARRRDALGPPHFWEFFQSVQTIFPLCWVSWAWADGVSRRALLFLLLLIFALNWEIMLKLKGTCLLSYATCQMFQHILYIRHFMVTEELAELKPNEFGLQKCHLRLSMKSLNDWLNAFYEPKNTFIFGAYFWQMSE